MSFLIPLGPICSIKVSKASFYYIVSLTIKINWLKQLAKSWDTNHCFHGMKSNKVVAWNDKFETILTNSKTINVKYLYRRAKNRKARSANKITRSVKKIGNVIAIFFGRTSLFWKILCLILYFIIKLLLIT